MKKWKMMALICVLCGSLSGCGLSFCGIPLGGREKLVFACGEKSVETVADESGSGGKPEKTQAETVDKTQQSTETAEPAEASETTETQEPTDADVAIADGRININTAGLEELQTLKGVGESRARAIIEYREQHGDFKAPEEIMNISGIKEGVFSKIKDQIAVR